MALKTIVAGKKKRQSYTPEEKIEREMKKLEKENESLRAENAFLKKLEEIERRREKASLSQVRLTDKYMAIQELHEEENLSIVLLCEIARIHVLLTINGLITLLLRNEKKNEEILKEIITLHEKVDGIYGYRRMTLNMNRKLS